MLVQDDGNLYGIQWSMLAVDLVMLSVLGALVWKARRGWGAVRYGVWSSRISQRLDGPSSIVSMERIAWRTSTWPLITQ